MMDDELAAAFQLGFKEASQNMNKEAQGSIGSALTKLHRQGGGNPGVIAELLTAGGMAGEAAGQGVQSGAKGLRDLIGAGAEQAKGLGPAMKSQGRRMDRRLREVGKRIGEGAGISNVKPDRQKSLLNRIGIGSGKITPEAEQKARQMQRILGYGAGAGAAGAAGAGAGAAGAGLS